MLSSRMLFVLGSTGGTPLTLDTAADIDPYIAVLENNADVEEIRLGGNTLGVEACKALARVLRTNTNLKIFNAADIFTGRLITEIPEALTALLTALLTLKNLHTVDLSDNAFGGRLADPLKEFYSRAGPLRHLLLNNNGLGPDGGSIVARAVRDLAILKASDPSLPPLETVVCGRNRLENGSMEAWAEAYAAHGTLRTIKMTQNGIRQEGIQNLLRAGLSKNPSLETLDLQDNTFTVRGATALALVLPVWKNLIELGVGDCLLSAKGSLLLGQALSKNKNSKLETLRLQYNEIDVKALAVIKAAIKTALPSLQRLEMNGNKFSNDHVLVQEIRAIFKLRKIGELDSLSDMESDNEDEDDDDEDGVEVDGKKEDVVKEAKRAEEDTQVSQEKDACVDQLADLLGETKI